MKVNIKSIKLFLLNPKLNDLFIIKVKLELTCVAKHEEKL